MSRVWILQFTHEIVIVDEFMNRLFCAVLFIITGIITEAQSRSIDYFEAKIYDLGEVMNSGGPIRCQFVLMNRTSQSLRIQSVNVSCGCLMAEWTKTMIKPREFNIFLYN